MRTSILLCCILFFAGTMLAQGRWSAGVDAQIAFTGMNKGDANEYDNNTGTVYYNVDENVLQAGAGAGLWAQYQITRGVGLRMGLGYLNSGNKDRNLSYSEVSATGRKTLFSDEFYEFRAHQLQVPIEFVLEPGKANVRMVFSVGAQLNNSWRATIYQENDYGNNSYSITSWDNENSSLDNRHQMIVQPVASIGVRINDQMLIRLRHAWAKPAELNWYQNYDHYDFSDSPEGVLTCGVGSYYSTTITNQRMTSLQFSYQIF